MGPCTAYVLILHGTLSKLARTVVVCCAWSSLQWSLQVIAVAPNVLGQKMLPLQSQSYQLSLSGQAVKAVSAGSSYFASTTIMASMVLLQGLQPASTQCIMAAMESTCCALPVSHLSVITICLHCTSHYRIVNTNAH
jgi:hypothetical protein